jgi:uncharacterized lipoprotein YmbA
MMRRRGFLAGTAMAAMTGLAGCSPAATQYRLEPLPGPVLGGAGLAVGVRSVNVPGYLDQNEIVKSGAAYQLSNYPNDVWADSLADMLQDVMVQDLAQRLPVATVIASGGAIGAPVGVVVEMNVLRFDPGADGDIRLDTQISVRRGEDTRHWRTVNFTRDAVPECDGPVGIVAAMSRLWGEAADQVAALLVMMDGAS